ncbi:MAG: hypothetical protein AAGI30_13805, partial [Planctomycetota bacterium]
MPTTLTLRCPADYDLPRDVCSYGYFLCAPNLWDPDRHRLIRPIELADGVATCAITQPGGIGTPIRVRTDRSLTRVVAAEARSKLVRMLRTDDDVSEFHRVDPRWKAPGRGRMFRSPTLFEDVIKTVSNCNISWPGTLKMNERLCEVINPAFPRAAQLARRAPASLRARCGVGYRDERIVELAKLFERGGVDEAWLSDPSTPDEEVEAELRTWPGIGPYAAANIMQLLGRYSRLALDTESVRHAREVLGMIGESKAIMKRLEDHYAPFGDHKFRSYWCELWAFYEAKKGPAWTWEPKTTGRTFTRAHFERDQAAQRKKKSRRRADCALSALAAMMTYIQIFPTTAQRLILC